MADESTYLVRLAAWLGRALGDTEALFAEFNTAELGIDLPDAVLQAPGPKAALGFAAAAAERLGSAATGVEAAAATGDDKKVLVALLKLGNELGAYFVALGKLAAAVEAAVTPATVPDAAQRAAAKAFANQLAKKLGDFALASALTEHMPDWALLLKLLGLLEWSYVPRQPGSALSWDHVERSLQLHRLGGLFSDPVQHLQATTGWGSPGFDPADYFVLYSEFFDEEDDVETGTELGEPFLRYGTFKIRRDSSVSPPGLRLSFVAGLEEAVERRTGLSGTWGANLATTLTLAGSVEAQVRPPQAVKLLPAAGEVSGELRAFVDRNPEARPFDILGGTGLLALSAQNVSVGVGLAATWDAGAGEASAAPLLFARLQGATLKLGTGGADSFIGSLLAGAEVEGEFSLGLEWRADTGLRVTGSGGMEIALPVHRQIGPVEIGSVYLALGIENDGALELEASAGLVGKLGPLTAVVERMGALLELRFAEDAGESSGPFGVSLGFKPPTGVGLAVDAGMVKGGGYLYFDTEREEYAGALELVFSGFLTLKAVGLVTTRMPDGSKGFSLLIVITAEFGSGVQLGFGFTLLGVGGLLGLNRTMRLEPLAEGIRTGGLNSVLFPKDVIANAPKIISDLRTYFPPQAGTFLIGPMAKLGWGTPTLVSLSLGIIIEIPGNVAILGVLKVALPDEKAALLVLQVSFIGAIEFDKKRVWFFASLFESRVLFMTIEGEMGLLVAWGDEASFVVSVGGFHPRFSPPPLPFPSPRRVAVDVLNNGVQRIRVEGYFAVTSNTAQFGARCEVFFGLDAINVSGHIGFDALFQFSPFYFVIDLSASFGVKVFGIGLFSVDVRMSLEGPTPWRAHGTGSLSLLFFDIEVDFDVTWGEKKDTTLPPIPVMPLLVAELGKPQSWRASLPAGSDQRVSLRKLPEDEAALVLHPVGVLRVSQRAVPLGLTLDKVGNRKVGDVKRLTLSVAAGGLGKRGDVREQFAPAQFQEMTRDEKLSRPAFGPELAGLDLSVAGEQLASSRVARRTVRYEEIVIDTAHRRFRRRFFSYSGALFAHFARGGSVSLSELSKSHKDKLQPFQEKIKVKADGYAVAFQADNRGYAADSVGFASEASAREYLKQHVEADPALAQTLHVIPEFERAA